MLQRARPESLGQTRDVVYKYTGVFWGVGGVVYTGMYGISLRFCRQNNTTCTSQVGDAPSELLIPPAALTDCAGAGRGAHVVVTQALAVNGTLTVPISLASCT